MNPPKPASPAVEELLNRLARVDRELRRLEDERDSFNHLLQLFQGRAANSITKDEVESDLAHWRQMLTDAETLIHGLEFVLAKYFPPPDGEGLTPG